MHNALYYKEGFIDMTAYLTKSINVQHSCKAKMKKKKEHKGLNVNDSYLQDVSFSFGKLLLCRIKYIQSINEMWWLIQTWLMFIFN